MTIGVRRVVVASQAIAATNTTEALNLTPDVGATTGYLKAASANTAVLRIGRDNDLSNEPYYSLAAGESVPIPFETEGGWFIRGAQNDRIEFVGDASE